MHNYNSILFYDLETSSANPHKTQPLQLACIAIHSRKLEIIPNSEFESMIYAHDDAEYCEAAGLDDIQEGALAVNKKTREEIASAPKLENVWSNFIDYVNNYNYKGNRWSSPILAGMNIENFDNIIVNRICSPDGYNLGPWDKERNQCTLFHPIHRIDLLKIAWMWFENTAEPKKLSMDTLRDFFGMSSENSHDAMQDVEDGARLLCKFLKLHRRVSKNVNWKNNK